MGPIYFMEPYKRGFLLIRQLITLFTIKLCVRAHHNLCFVFVLLVGAFTSYSDNFYNWQFGWFSLTWKISIICGPIILIRIIPQRVHFVFVECWNHDFWLHTTNKLYLVSLLVAFFLFIFSFSMSYFCVDFW